MYYNIVNIINFLVKEIKISIINNQERTILKMSSQNKVMKPEDLKANIKNIKWGEIKTNKRGGKTVYPTINGKKVQVMLPTLLCPYGVSMMKNGEVAKDPTEEGIKFSASLSLGSTVEDKTIVDIFEAVNEATKDYAVTESKKLFGKTVNKVSIDVIFKNGIKKKDKKDDDEDKVPLYPPRMSVKIVKDYEGDDFSGIKVYNEKQEKMKLNIHNICDHMKRNTEIRTVLECAGIWVVGGNFGISWKIKNMIIYPNEDDSDEFPFDDEPIEQRALNNNFKQMMSKELTEEPEEIVEETTTSEPEDPTDPLEAPVVVESSDEEPEAPVVNRRKRRT